MNIDVDSLLQDIVEDILLKLQNTVGWIVG